MKKLTLALIPAVALAAPHLTMKPVVVTSKAHTFQIALKSNATTGYRWFLQGSLPKWIQPVSYKYVPPGGKLVGAPGTAVFTFRATPNAALIPRVAALSFVEQRPWMMFGSQPKVITVLTRPAE